MNTQNYKLNKSFCGFFVMNADNEDVGTFFEDDEGNYSFGPAGGTTWNSEELSEISSLLTKVKK